MALGKLIKQTSEEQGRTIKWLAAQTGISENTLYAIIKRDSDNIPLENLEKISNAFEIDIIDFISYALDVARAKKDYRSYGVLIDKYINALDNRVLGNANGNISLEERELAILDALEEQRNVSEKKMAELQSLSIQIENEDVSLTSDELQEWMLFRDFLIFKRSKNGK